MKKKLFLLLLFVLGFLLMPGKTMACENKSLKSASHKEMPSKNAEEHSCCNSSYSKNKKHSCDGGKCIHTKCGCTSSYSLFLFFTASVTSNAVIEIVSTTQRFPNLQTFVSTGYGSLWLIPKIG